MEFADEEHFRRHVRKVKREVEKDLWQMLTYLEEGEVWEARYAGNAAETRLSALDDDMEAFLDAA